MLAAGFKPNPEAMVPAGASTALVACLRDEEGTVRQAALRAFKDLGVTVIAPHVESIAAATSVRKASLQPCAIRC